MNKIKSHDTRMNSKEYQLHIEKNKNMDESINNNIIQNESYFVVFITIVNFLQRKMFLRMNIEVIVDESLQLKRITCREAIINHSFSSLEILQIL